MKLSLLKRGLVAGAAMVSVLVALPSVSGAIQLTAAGSDTTQKVMDQILKQAYAPSGDTWTNVATYPTDPVDVAADANCANGIRFQPTTGANAKTSGDITGYNNDGTATTAATKLVWYLAPNGSGAGRTALANFASKKTYGTNNTGCVDIARSSSYTGSFSGVAAGKLEFYGFGLDAVSWATTSSNAPATLTQKQISDIFNCTVTDWAQVGGSPGPIKVFMPPSTSGTREFFLAQYLGAAKEAVGTACAANQQTSGGTYDASKIYTEYVPNPAGSGNIYYEENQADTIPAVDWDKAIFPYSAGQWVYQANNAANPTIDRRMAPGGGVKARIGAIDAADHSGDVTNANGVKTTVAKAKNANHTAWNRADGVWQLNTKGLANLSSYGYPAASSTDFGGYVVDEANAPQQGSCRTVGTTTTTPCPFLGVRIVFNVLDTDSPNYTEARAAVGFDNSASGAKSPLCSGGRESIISSYGFAPLDTNEHMTGTNAAGSTCRKFVTTS